MIAALTTALVAALATFAWMQRQDARQAQTDLAATQEAQRLANQAASAISTDSQLSLLLAMEAVRSTAKLGYAMPEAVDAVHWAMQKMGVQYAVARETLTAARFGPAGVHGVWVLPVDELMDLAQANTVRSFSSDECQLYFGDEGCPAAVSVAGLRYFGGLDEYTNAVAFDQAEVVVAASEDGGEWLQNLQAIGEQYGVRIQARQIPRTLTATEVVTQGFPGDIVVIPRWNCPNYPPYIR